MPHLGRKNALVLLFLLTLLHHHLTVVHLIVHFLMKKHRRIHKRPNIRRDYTMIERIPHQSFRMDRLVNISDKECNDNLRMDRNAFGRFCFLMREIGGLSDSKYVSVKEQLAIFLSVLAHHKKNRVLQFDFWRSGQTLSHYVHVVLRALLKMHTILMVNPTPVETDSTHATWKWFKSKCTICNAEIESGSLIPNHALRAVAQAVKQEDDRRLFHNAALRKRRKEACEHGENGDITPENGSHRGVQYPFSVNEKVIIRGNKRTPDKFVGKEAVITSQSLNGWYLLKIMETGVNVRLQYRSLRKIPSPHVSEDRCVSQQVQISS